MTSVANKKFVADVAKKIGFWSLPIVVSVGVGVGLQSIFSAVSLDRAAVDDKSVVTDEAESPVIKALRTETPVFFH